MTEQLIQDLTKARDLLESDGWTQGRYYDNQGCHCAVGVCGTAVVGNALAYDYPRVVLVVNSLAETLGKLHTHAGMNRDVVFDFNDNKAEQKSDVIALFNKTIDRLQ